jgi:phi13 family phage major tail protein
MTPVNANQGEYRSTIGLDSLHVAEVTQDDASAYVADTPEYFAPAAQASQAPVTSQEVQYADDGVHAIVNSENETDIQLTITGLPLKMQALVLGKVFDSTTGRMYDNVGTPPDMALSFRSLKTNGSYRYYQYLKGQFSVPNEEAATRAATADPKTVQLNYKAMKTVHEFDLGDTNGPVKRIVGDEDTTNFSGTTWFNQVQTPVVGAIAPLALSASDPADGAAAVAVDKTVTLTFNNKLTAAAVNNVVIVKADGTVAAAAVTLDTIGKIVTINPDPNLGAAATYLVTYAVIDIYGQALSGAINFATA